MEISSILIKIIKQNEKKLWNIQQGDVSSDKRTGKLAVSTRGCTFQVWGLDGPQKLGIFHEGVEVES